jgi:large subunit ribosomal protein L15
MPKKRGFKSVSHIEYAAVNVGALQALATAGVTEITKAILAEKGIIRNAEVFVKLLGDGEITSKVTVQAEKVSGSAQEKIEKAGGKVELLAK